MLLDLLLCQSPRKKVFGSRNRNQFDLNKERINREMKKRGDREEYRNFFKKEIFEKKIKLLEEKNAKLNVEKETISQKLDKILKDQATLSERKELAKKMAASTEFDEKYWVEKLGDMSLTEFQGVLKIYEDIKLSNVKHANRINQDSSNDDIGEVMLEDEKIEGNIVMNKGDEGVELLDGNLQSLAQGFVKEITNIKKYREDLKKN